MWIYHGISSRESIHPGKQYHSCTRIDSTSIEDGRTTMRQPQVKEIPVSLDDNKSAPGATRRASSNQRARTNEDAKRTPRSFLSTTIPSNHSQSMTRKVHLSDTRYCRKHKLLPKGLDEHRSNTGDTKGTNPARSSRGRQTDSHAFRKPKTRRASA